MLPLGRLPVTFRLGGTDDLHINPDIYGIIHSWKACKALHILSPGYPNPIAASTVHEITLPPGNNITSLTLQDTILAYPIIFDGQIRNMAGNGFTFP